MPNGTSVCTEIPLESCLSRSLKVIGTDATYDFLFLIHSEWINGDLRFRSKIANFFTSQAFNVPAEGFAFEICNGVEL